MNSTTYDSWLRILNPNIIRQLGHIKHALFDFDGTFSVLRQGWENYMLPVMLEAICGVNPVTPEIEQEVREYIDHSTGILTILQMQWLENKVKQYGLAVPKSAAEYKAIYLLRLMVKVNLRITQVNDGSVTCDQMMVQGSRKFIEGLRDNKITLYLVSGTDHDDVVREAKTLHMDHYFNGGVYGALDEIEQHSKERIIQRILDDHHLSGNGLLVVGDGKVEIMEANSRNAIALGVASNEVDRNGWNEWKVRRLTQAGSDLLISDFSHSNELLSLLLEKQNNSYA